MICKFYAKQESDKKRSLLRDVAISENGEVLITDSKNKNVKVSQHLALGPQTLASRPTATGL